MHFYRKTSLVTWPRALVFVSEDILQKERNSRIRTRGVEVFDDLACDSFCTYIWMYIYREEYPTVDCTIESIQVYFVQPYKTQKTFVIRELFFWISQTITCTVKIYRQEGRYIGVFVTFETNTTSVNIEQKGRHIKRKTHCNTQKK
jgi:hypothetical protein